MDENKIKNATEEELETWMSELEPGLTSITGLTRTYRIIKRELAHKRNKLSPSALKCVN